MGRKLMKKIIVFTVLSILSLFLPATLKPNSETFKLEPINYIEILTFKPVSLCLILLSILVVVLSYTTFKNYQKLALGFLAGTYLQFVLSYINWTYLGKTFFRVYLYGFWVQTAFSMIVLILLYQASQTEKSLQ